MLIISRKENEEIMIDHDIKVKILSISENQVKLGISAPDSITIYRSELYNKIKEMIVKASSPDINPNVESLNINKFESNV